MRFTLNTAAKRGEGTNKIRNKKDIPHFLDIADCLSSNAWLKWSKKQEKAAK